MTNSAVLIVGHEGEAHVGGSLLSAARALGVPAELIDAQAAYAAPRAVARVNWWLLGRRPTHLGAFSASVVERLQRARPAVMVATGLAPVNAAALERASQLGVVTVNFLTDDPWSPVSRSRWFLEALPHYQHVFTPRRANIADLRGHGCPSVTYLPFGYDPLLFFPEPPDAATHSVPAADVFFAGGADDDRRPYVAALLSEGLTVALYGRYWDRYPETRAVARGQAAPDELRRAISTSRVCLGLVRRVNRDGHSMRSIEVPAAGGCLLAERTEEHLEIFGPDGEAVVYFDDVKSMVRAARELVSDDARRRRLTARAHEIVTTGGYTYADRLRTLVETAARQPALAGARHV